MSSGGFETTADAGGISENEAARRARAALELPEGTPARALRVRRLDQESADYYLVLLGDEHRPVGVVTVDIGRGDVGSRARLAGGGPHLSVEEAAARRLAGAAKSAAAQLVWQPSAASRSPLYPFWAIQDDSGESYVDQQGNVLRSLRSKGSG